MSVATATKSTAPSPVSSPESTVSASSPRLSISWLGMRRRAAWDAYVDSHPEGSLFHRTAWLEAVQEAFGHRPCHLVAMEGERIVGVLPLFQIDSLLGGRMLVSVPYAVSGGILADGRGVREALWRRAREHAGQVAARSVDIRSERGVLEDARPVEGYVKFVRELPDTVGGVLGWLPRKARAAARNGRDKHGLTSEIDDACLPALWRLYARNMRRLGSICYPYAFFAGLLERHRRDAFVQIVRFEGRIIAGLMSFRFRDTFMPYFAGCDERFNRCNTNNFMYLKAMEQAVEAGCRTFDFGRTRTDNRGPYDFKRFCAFEPQPLGYQRYEPGERSAVNLTPSNPRFRLIRRVWTHLPLPVSIRLGMFVSRHIAG